MKKRNYILLAAVFVFFAVATLLFLAFVRDTMGYRTPAGKAEAIVVLTGGRGRVEEGLDLLRSGAAGVMILSGVHEDADIDSIYLKKISNREKFRIILEKRSKSTYENAVEVKKLLAAYDIRSIILITSLYHMKRAEYIFSHVLQPGVRLETLSVSSPNFDESGWWSGNSLMILLVEFVKYYWYVVTLGIA